MTTCRNPHACLALLAGPHWKNLSVVTADMHRITLALLFLVDGAPSEAAVDFATIAPWLAFHGEPFVFTRGSHYNLVAAGMPATQPGQDVLVRDVPGNHGKVFRLVGRNTLDIRPGFHLGIDEWCGFDFIDFRYHPAHDAVTIGHRFAEYKDAKPAGSTRARTRDGYWNMINIMSPLAEATLADCLIEIPHDPSIIPVVHSDLPQVARPIPSAGSDQWRSYFWWVDLAPLVAAPDSYVVLEGQARWADGDIASAAAGFELRVDSSAGYLPQRRVRVADDGTVRARVSTMGLIAGDRISVKVGSTHFSRIGSGVVEVV